MSLVAYQVKAVAQLHSSEDPSRPEPFALFAGVKQVNCSLMVQGRKSGSVWLGLPRHFTAVLNRRLDVNF